MHARFAPHPALVTGAPVAAALGFAAAVHPVATLIALALGVLLVITMVRADWLLIGFVAMMPWEGLISGPSEVLTPTRLAGVLLLTAYAYRLARGRLNVPIPRSFVPLVVLSLCVVASTLAAGAAGDTFDTTFRYLSAIAFFFFTVQLVETKAEAKRLMAVFGLSAAAAACWGLVAFLTGAEPAVQGPIDNPNDFAFILGATLPFLLYLASAATSAWSRTLWIACAALAFGGVLGTLSRGALLAGAVVVVWAALSGRISARAVATGLLAACLVAFCAYAVAPGVVEGRLSDKSRIADDNVSSRESFWGAGLAMGADHPLLGVGPGQFDTLKPEYVRNDPTSATEVGTVERTSGVHNTYLSILVDAGAVAFAMFLAFLVLSWRMLARARESAGSLSLVSALQASLLFSAVASLFIAVQYEVPFWLVGALAAIVARDGVSRRARA